MRVVRIITHLENGAIHVLEDEVQLATVAENLMQSDNVLMRKAPQYPHLPQSSLANLVTDAGNQVCKASHRDERDYSTDAEICTICSMVS